MTWDRVRDQQSKVASGEPIATHLAPEIELGVQIIVRSELVSHLNPQALLAYKRNVLAYAESAAGQWLDDALSCFYCKNFPARKRGEDVLCADCEHFLGQPE